MTKKLLLLLLLCATAPKDAAVVARIGSVAVTREEVLKNAAVRLQNVDEERRQCLEQHDRERDDALAASLRNVVRRRLLDLEAAKRGVTVAALLASVTPAAVSDDDVRRFRDANARRFAPDANEADVIAAIRTHLTNEAHAEAVDRLYAELELAHGARYLLDARRVDVKADGPSDGPPSAPVTVVVFGDYECPACSTFAPLLGRLRQDHGDALRVVSRQFPLPMHPNARRAAEASLCVAKQGKFQAMHDALYAEERELTPAVLREVAIAAKADAEVYDRCVASRETAAEVERDVAAAIGAGVNGTPTVFVNGRLFGGGPYTELSSLVREERVRASTASR
ncbi:MAG TPA: DsbA family protein [Thermoanaerobaculia bacterium]